MRKSKFKTWYDLMDFDKIALIEKGMKLNTASKMINVPISALIAINEKLYFQTKVLTESDAEEIRSYLTEKIKDAGMQNRTQSLRKFAIAIRKANRLSKAALPSPTIGQNSKIISTPSGGKVKRK